MRILIVGAFPEASQPPRGGVEAAVWQLARHLAMLPDTDVHLASVERHDEPAVRVVDGVTVHAAPEHGRRLPGLVAAATTDALFVRQLAQRLQPDVVHGFGLGGDGLGAVSSGRPHLLTPRLLPPPVPLRGPAALVRAAEVARTSLGGWPLRHAQHVAVVSPHVGAVVRPLARGRLHDLPPPVAPDFFDIIPGTRPDLTPTLLAVGNMVPRKRHDLAVRSLAVVRREVPDARLRIAGHVGPEGRPLLEELRELARELDVEDAVDFLGGVTEGRLLREYAEADVLVHTAGDATSPLAITQAMASGLPTVAVDIPGVRHLVRHEATGLLADPATPRVVAGAAVRLLTDPDLAAALGATARSQAHREFEPLGVARRARGLYADIRLGA